MQISCSLLIFLFFSLAILLPPPTTQSRRNQPLLKPPEDLKTLANQINKELEVYVTANGLPPNFSLKLAIGYINEACKSINKASEKWRSFNRPAYIARLRNVLSEMKSNIDAFENSKLSKQVPLDDVSTYALNSLKKFYHAAATWYNKVRPALRKNESMFNESFKLDDLKQTNEFVEPSASEHMDDTLPINSSFKKPVSATQNKHVW